MNLVILAGVISFVLTALIGPKLIGYLRKMKFGQKILEIGPKWHMNKQYTPTMGGFMFIIGISAVCLLYLLLRWADARLLPVWLLALAYGLIGFIDDYAKIRKKQNMGLTARQKFALQVAVAILFLAVLRIQGALSPALYLPFTTITVHVPWILYLIFAAFVIVGAVNAVNLTDGIDGLAAGVTLPVAIFFAIVGVMASNQSVAVFSAALAGGLAAFLIYNFNPAKVFMGDTGSLFLGGCVVGLAFAYDMPLVLILVGLIYIIETLSDILQVTYFKITHGKRIFKMAPIHHHFEMCGWSEKEIVLVFSTVTIIMCILAYFGVMPKFG